MIYETGWSGAWCDMHVLYAHQIRISVLAVHLHTHSHTHNTIILMIGSMIGSGHQSCGDGHYAPASIWVLDLRLHCVEIPLDNKGPFHSVSMGPLAANSLTGTYDLQLCM